MLNQQFKQNVHQACLNHIEKSLQVYQAGIKDAQEGLQSESKSSAGDKHETGRAMLQLEAEKLGAQYQERLKTYNFVKQLNIKEIHHQIKLGSLIKTNLGLFYICSGIGSIAVDDQNIFVLSPIAPLSKMLLSKKKDDSITFNRKTISIQSII